LERRTTHTHVPANTLPLLKARPMTSGSSTAQRTGDQVSPASVERKTPPSATPASSVDPSEAKQVTEPPPGPLVRDQGVTYSGLTGFLPHPTRTTASRRGTESSVQRVLMSTTGR